MPFLPAAVIFDMDGLLFDSEALSRDSVLAAARELGHDFTVDDFLALVGRPWTANRISLEARFGSVEIVDTFRTAWIRHYDAMSPSLALKAGVVELLDRIDQLGIPRAICTSSPHEDVQFNLELHGLTHRFETVVASGDYARSKPAPDPFLRAAEMLGVPPADCLALEDPHNGVRAAAAAGMRTIMVPDLLPATEEIRGLCHTVAVDLHAVRALLG